MSFLAGVDRSASVAWCPVVGKGSFFASATSAATINENFDTSSCLESFQVDMACMDANLTPKSKLNLPDRVHGLAWGQGGKNGIIAAGYQSGEMTFLDASPLFDEESTFENAVIASSSKHSSAVACLKFNPLQTQIMASGASNSEVLIWNMARPETPVAYAPGAVPLANQNITDLQWNCNVPHILGTVSESGHVVVWDLRNKRPAVQFTDRTGQLKNCRSISWNPVNTMQLVTASADNNNPIIQVWNLRNTQMPVATLKGHTQGINSTSWCPHDDKYLLSVGNDNRALCWDVEAAAIVHDIPLRSENNVSVEWSKEEKAIFSVASITHGKVDLYSIHDFHGKKTAQGTFDRSTPPSWLRRPAGASFGFGGKLLRVNGSSVSIEHVVSQPDVVDAAQRIEQLIHLENGQEYCENRAAETETKEDKEMWRFLAAQFQQDPRNAILNELGFDKEAISRAVQQITAEVEEKKEEVKIKSEYMPHSEDVAPKEEGEVEEDDVSNLFGSSDDPFGAPSPHDDPFGGLSHSDDPFGAPHADEWSQMGTKSFDGEEKYENNQENNNNGAPSIIEIASAKDFPLRFLCGSDNEQVLIKNIMMKNYEAAIECCFRMERKADALAVAMSSNDISLMERTQARYYATLPQKSALHIVEKLSKNKLREIVGHADVDEWKCTLALICSYASPDEFSSLCVDLGDLLAHCGNTFAANLCFICANDLDRAVALWNSSQDTGDRLNNLEIIMERICILRKLVDSDSISAEAMTKYCEFARLLASQGQLELAFQFVSFLSGESSDCLANRIQTALAATPPTPAAPVASTPAPIAATTHSRATPSVVTPFNPVAPAPTNFGFQNPSNPAPGFQNPSNPAPGFQNPSNPAPGFQNPRNPVPVMQQTPFTPTAVFNPVTPLNPPVQNNFGLSNPSGTFNPAPVGQQVPFTPTAVFNPVAPVQVPAMTPIAVQTPPNVFTPGKPGTIPKVESLPAAITKPDVAPGKTEIADKLAATIEALKGQLAADPNAQKLLKGCSADRINMLRERLRKNEISPDASNVLELFVAALQSKNKQDMTIHYQWLVEKKYSEVSAKVMLGLKKLNSINF